jgi:hypothetical protein
MSIFQSITDAFNKNTANSPHSHETQVIIERTFSTALELWRANPPTLTPAEQAYVDSILSKVNNNNKK